MLSIKKELTICPRCGSSNIYLVMDLSEENQISCAKCGFIGESLEK